MEQPQIVAQMKKNNDDADVIIPKDIVIYILQHINDRPTLSLCIWITLKDKSLRKEVLNHPILWTNLMNLSSSQVKTSLEIFDKFPFIEDTDSSKPESIDERKKIVISNLKKTFLKQTGYELRCNCCHFDVIWKVESWNKFFHLGNSTCMFCLVYNYKEILSNHVIYGDICMKEYNLTEGELNSGKIEYFSLKWINYDAQSKLFLRSDVEKYVKNKNV